MDRKWMPTVAGILDVIIGIFTIIAGVAAELYPYWGNMIGGFPVMPMFSYGLLRIIAIVLISVGVLALAAGICSLMREVWEMALAGSIISAFFWWPLGIPAIIFVGLSKQEFDHK